MNWNPESILTPNEFARMRVVVARVTALRERGVPEDRLFAAQLLAMENDNSVSPDDMISAMEGKLSELESSMN